MSSAIRCALESCAGRKTIHGAARPPTAACAMIRFCARCRNRARQQLRIGQHGWRIWTMKGYSRNFGFILEQGGLSATIALSWIWNCAWGAGYMPGPSVDRKGQNQGKRHAIRGCYLRETRQHPRVRYKCPTINRASHEDATAARITGVRMFLGLRQCHSLRREGCGG